MRSQLLTGGGSIPLGVRLESFEAHALVLKLGALFQNDLVENLNGPLKERELHL